MCNLYKKCLVEEVVCFYPSWYTCSICPCICWYTWSIVVVQLLSYIWILAAPWSTASQASLSITTPGVYSSSCPSSWWCHPTVSSSVIPFSSCPQSLPASGAFQMSQLFTSGTPSNEHPGLISFRMDWLDLLAVQGTLKSLFQHHSSKASILWCSAFFIVLLSCPYMTTEKNIALTRCTFVAN